MTLAAQELEHSLSLRYSAPAGNLPTAREITIDGLSGAILPNGRFITPPGVEVKVGAPKPFGMALSPDGNTLATINSGVGPFSITLITHLKNSAPSTSLIQVNASFLGIIFSSDSSRFYASGGENGNVWVGDAASAKIIGSVNLNGRSHPYGSLNVVNGAAGKVSHLPVVFSLSVCKTSSFREQPI